MALMKCPECGKEISTEAAACPQCGAPKAKRGRASAARIGKLIGASVVLFFLLLIVIGMMSSTPTEEKKQAGAAPVIDNRSPEQIAMDERLKQSCAANPCSISQNVTVEHHQINTPGCMDYAVASYMQDANLGAFAAHQPVLTAEQLGRMAEQNGFAFAGSRCMLIEDGKQGRVVNVTRELLLVAFDSNMAPLWFATDDLRHDRPGPP